MILKGWIFNFLKIQLTEFIIKSYYNQTIHPDIDSNNDETETTASKTPQIPSTTTNISQRDNCPIHSKTRIGNTPLTQCTSLDNALHANIPHPLAITHPLHRHSAHSPPFAPPFPPGVATFKVGECVHWRARCFARDRAFDVWRFIVRNYSEALRLWGGRGGGSLWKNGKMSVVFGNDWKLQCFWGFMGWSDIGIARYDGNTKLGVFFFRIFRDNCSGFLTSVFE